MSTTSDVPRSPPSIHQVQPELAADQARLLEIFLGPAAPGAPPQTPKDAARVVNRVGQRDLQALFHTVYSTETKSNNNAWLRRKLLEAIGLPPPSKSAAGKRRPPSTATRPPRPPAKRAKKAPAATPTASAANAPLACPPAVRVSMRIRKPPAPYAEEVAAYEAETAARRARPARLPATPRLNPLHPPSPLLAFVPGACAASPRAPRAASPAPPAGAAEVVRPPGARSPTASWSTGLEGALAAQVAAAATAAAAAQAADAAGLAPSALLPPASLVDAGSEGEDETDVSSQPASPLARAAAAALGGAGGLYTAARPPLLPRPHPQPPAAIPTTLLTIDWGLAGPALAAGAGPAIARRLSTAALLYEDGGDGAAGPGAAVWRGEAGLLAPTSLPPLPPVQGAASPAAAAAAAWAGSAMPLGVSAANPSLDSAATVVAGGDAALRTLLAHGPPPPPPPPPPSAAVMDAAAALGLGSASVSPGELRARLAELERWVDGVAPGGQ